MKFIKIGNTIFNMDSVEFIELSTYNNDVYVWFWWSESAERGDCMTVMGNDAIELRAALAKLKEVTP